MVLECPWQRLEENRLTAAKGRQFNRRVVSMAWKQGEAQEPDDLGASRATTDRG
jgi:hypothetical protein